MTKKQKKTLWRILTSAAFFAAALLGPWSGWLRLAVFLVPYIVIGYDVLWKAVRNISHGQVFDENFLMSLATVGAFFIGEYAEAVAVMLFYQVGELFQSYAVGRSRRSIAALMDIRPDYANLERDGQLCQVDPEEVEVGQTIVIRSGERIPLDGVILTGSSSLDTAALTGESVPRDVAPGDAVISGCINGGGLLRVQVTRSYGQSTVARILDLVENASGKKARAEHFITRFARYYTPAVVIAAAALALVPPLLLGGGWSSWLRRALIFLVISCPCALVISVPLSFFGGIGGASRQGILVKGGNYLEALAKTKVLVFDKTGTLTQGTFQVTEVRPASGVDGDHLLELAALAEGGSNHPIAQSLQAAWKGKDTRDRVTEFEEIPGMGVRAVVDGATVWAGNSRLMEKAGASMEASAANQGGTVIHLAVGSDYQGSILISDSLKPDAVETIRLLKARGIRTVMLTGDSLEAGQAAAQRLGMDEVHTRLLPEDKVHIVERLLAEKPSGSTLAFVGDGVNDAPVLSRADVGIAMGGLGSDAAIEAADVVLMDDQPHKIVDAMDISRRTLKIVRQNVIFALGVKALVLLMGAWGAANLWEAVFADVGVSVIAILNASRALHTGKNSAGGER
ncbi:heavy metal translocating P-type ATPase [Angelakisella massiliensis]|uniref:heavy metal translocating P-type ATPase n=1 Tax=Angelakisella massiliensis TaxID=1871018 RepID=UPI0008F8A0BB|nr:heavy metal translocating P-type ATPase [Angelakisella massiliensis]